MKRSKKYRPRAVRVSHVLNLIAHAQPTTSAPAELQLLRLKHHIALDLLRQGKGAEAQVKQLISCFNVSEALVRQGILPDEMDTIIAGQEALYSLVQRFGRTGVFAFTGPELTAVNAAMASHDDQLDCATVGHVVRAVRIIDDEFRAGRMRVFKIQNDDDN